MQTNYVWEYIWDNMNPDVFSIYKHKGHKQLIPMVVSVLRLYQ